MATKVFKERGISAEGKVLPLSEFKLFSDMDNPIAVPEKIDLIIKKAEEIVNDEIPFIPLSSYREFKITGNRTNFESKYFARRDMLLYLALAEHFENKGRFKSKLVDTVWAVLEETSWVIHAHAIHNPADPKADVPPVYNETDLHGIDLFSAETGALFATVLLLCREQLDSISPILVERIEYEVKKRIIKPFISHHFGWCGEYGSKVNNWCPWITENVLFITAIVEENKRIRETVVARAMKYLDNYTTWLPDDGGCDEGPGYWGGACGAYFTALEVIYDMTGGAVDVFDHPLVKNMCEYIVKFNINGTRYVNFADCDATVKPDAFMIMRMGKRCGLEELLAFGENISRYAEQLIGTRHIYRGLKNLYMERVTDAKPTLAKPFVWMPGLKAMIARESTDTSHGMFIAMKGGHNKESHNHNDVGHYIIYKNGEPVIIDPGSVRYTRDTFGPKRYTFWAMQSHYHNLPAFDGFGEFPGPEAASTREECNEDAFTVSLGLEKAYEAAAGVVEYTRCATLSGSVVTVKENVVLDSEREIDFRLMTHVKPEVIGEGKIALANGATLEYDKRLEYEMDELDPNGTADLEKRWGTPVLFRMHFKIRAKEYNGEFKFY